MEKSEMIAAVVPNIPYRTVNQVNVILNQQISAAQNGASVVVTQSIVIVQLVSITNFWANDGMLRSCIPWKFHYLV